MVPLGPAYLMGQLDEGCYEKVFRAFSLDDQGEPVVPEDIVTLSPDVCSHTVISGYETIYLKLNSRLKDILQKPFLSIFGGPHVTFNPFRRLFGKKKVARFVQEPVEF
ncbi:MAG: hypothetical protein A2X84_14355 [Desulfuromonadaceae bacterium GWC2_58_13]|nr:MAG: hypothetical protein A2X84_14355 [Desulfuromonadaceae bacterium GWC2_58_13]